MEEYKFTVQYRVEFADSDSKYDLKTQTLVAWASELAGDHLRSRNITREQMIIDGQVFLLTRVAIHYEKVPSYMDNIYLTTWECGTKGSQFVRRFTAKDKSGNILADIETYWILVDPASHKILRPGEYAYELLINSDTTTARVEKFKTDTAEFIKDYTFVYSDIDPNRHVNNGTYIRLVTDLFGENEQEKHFKDFAINFIHESRLGETISLYKTVIDNEVYVAGKNAEDKTCFEVKYSLM